MLLNDLENEIHIWFCCPEEIMDKAKLDIYLAMLSAEEKARYQRFHYEKDRHSYLISHALLRTVLSKYCDVLPQQWSFTVNEHGKPALASLLDYPPLHFNLSHTDGLSACIVSLNNECGIDVENKQRQNRLLAIAERMFAEAELATMRDVTDDEMRNKFFDYWTLREAYVKALGSGLSGSSKKFYFDVAESTGLQRSAKLSFIDECNESMAAWQFCLLAPSSNHVAALAYCSEPLKSKKIVSRQIVP